MSETSFNQQQKASPLPSGSAWLVIVGLSFLLYGISNILNYAVFGAFIVGMLMLMRHGLLDLLLIPLFYFDNVLLLPFASGTYIRLFEVVYVIYFFWAGSGKVKVRDITKFIIAILYFLMSIWYSFSLNEAISAFLNVFVVYLIYNDRIKENLGEQNKADSNLNLILFSFALASLLAAIYAFIRGNRVYGFRLAGTITDPNYTAILYVYGIFATIGCRTIGIKEKRVFLAMQIVALLATVSFSGILCFAILLILFIYTIKPSRAWLIGAVILVLLYILVNIPDIGIPFITGFQSRFQRSMNAFLVGDYITLTSHRYQIFEVYLNKYLHETSIFRQFFGGTDPTVRGFIDTSNLYQSYVVSHNSYLDMLFMVGLVGFITVIVSIVTSSKKYYNIYKRTSEISYLSLSFIKLATLLMSFSLSLFPYKLFTISFLL